MTTKTKKPAEKKDKIPSPQTSNEPADNLRKLDGQIEQKDKNYDEYKIKKDMEQMEKNGFFDDPEKYDKNERKKELLKEYDVFETRVNKKTGEIIRTGRINTANLGTLIYNESGKYFFTMRDNKEIYAYVGNDGYFEKQGDTWIRKETELYIGDKVTEHIKNEAVGYIRDYNYTNRETHKTDLNLINLANGVLNIDTKELLPHSPQHLFLNQIPVNYDPEADYTEFEKFLNQICMKEGIPRKKIVDTIQEYMGYGFYRAYPFKNYIVLDGGGDNGKTVLLNIEIALIGEKNNTSVSLQDLNSRPFSKKQLYAKHLNASDDLPKKALKFTGVIKQVTGNSMIWADIKGHIDGINFKPYAKPWYACNELPETTDYTDAFFSRQIQITLLNKYLPKGDKKINGVSVFERDVGKTKELTTPEMLSGILNYALIGLKRLLKNKVFSDDVSTDEKRTIWMRKTNPVHAFIEDEIEIAGDDWGIAVDDFFSEIVSFCERNEFDVPTARKPVTTRLLDENIGVRKIQKTVNGTPRVWCWIGIKSTTNENINQYFGKRKDGVIF